MLIGFEKVFCILTIHISHDRLRLQIKSYLIFQLSVSTRHFLCRLGLRACLTSDLTSECGAFKNGVSSKDNDD